MLRRIAADARGGKLLAAMLATPCTSFSIARNRTHVIRTPAEPWGANLGTASPKDIACLHSGNATLIATIKLIKLFNRHKIPWIMENPATSRIWHIPELLEAFKRANAHWITTDFCGFGTRWRKRTTLVCGNLEPCDTGGLGRTCCGRHGFCSYTKKKHFQLTGSSPGGVPWTRVAQPYPRKLAAQLAKALTERHFATATYNRAVQRKMYLVNNRVP